MKSMKITQSFIKNNGVIAESALRAMSDGEYMNAQQTSFFADKLSAMQKRLVAATSLDGREIRETAQASDPVDRASDEESRNNEQIVRVTELRQLADVNRSLSKITNGDYGYCDETGEPIGIPRLLARPTANLTVEEQSRREQKLARTVR